MKKKLQNFTWGRFLLFFLILFTVNIIIILIFQRDAINTFLTTRKLISETIKYLVISFGFILFTLPNKKD